MSQPYVGEIRMFAGNYAPDGWMFCEGQQLAIAQNEALFQVVGTAYGGDGESTFALPDLRGRIPVHQGNGLRLAATGGVEEVTLTTGQLPAHSHPLLGTSALATTNSPEGNAFAQSTGVTVFPYGTDQPLTTLDPYTIAPVGGSQPHTNFQPYLCVDFIVSLYGIFPSPT